MTGIRRNILFSIAERYAGFAINLAAMIILSRLLTPAETGLYSIAAALINIAQALRNFGVYIYLLQEKELTDEKIGSAAGISLIIAGLLAAAFILAAETIASFYNSHALTQLIFILSGNFIIVAYTAVGHGLLTRDMNFRPVMVISIAGTVTNATVSVVLAALGFGAACLAWASLSGVVVVLLGYVVVLRRRALIPPNLKHWRTIFRFGVFSSASGILDEMNNRSPDLIIGRLVSLEGVGLFSRGSGLVSTLHSLITGAVQSVVSGLFAKTHREETDLPGTYLKALSFVCIVAWPALGLLVVLAHPTIELAFGPQWLPSVPVAQVLSAGAAISLVGMLAQMLLRATGAVQQNFMIQLTAVPVYITSIAAGATHGLAEAAAGAVISGTLISGLSILVLRRRIALPVLGLLRVLWPALLCAAATAGAAFAVVHVLGQTPRCLVPAGLLALATWLGAVHVLRHPIHGEIRLAARHLLRRQRAG